MQLVNEVVKITVEGGVDGERTRRVEFEVTARAFGPDSALPFGPDAASCIAQGVRNMLDEKGWNVTAGPKEVL